MTRTIAARGWPLIAAAGLAFPCAAQIAIPPEGRAALPEPAWLLPGLMGETLAADLDNNGYPDIYAEAGRWGANNGHGVFTTADSVLPKGPAAPGDVNGDGYMDLAIRIGAKGTAAIWLGTGSGHFAAAGSQFVGYQTYYSIALADFDEDGVPDVVAGNFTGPGTVAVLLGDGDGGLLPPAKFGADPFCVDVATGDFNLDGHLDVLAALSTLSERILLGDGTGVLTDGSQQDGYGGYHNELGDLDADGWPDVIAVSGYSFSQLSWTRNELGSLPPVPTATWDMPYVGDVVAADLVGDGFPDIVFNGSSAVGFGVIGNESGTLGPPITIPNEIDGGWVDVADFDVDGHIDVLHSANSASVLRGDGAGGLLTTQVLDLPAELSNDHLMRSAQLDGDGRADLVVLSQHSPNFGTALSAVPSAWTSFTLTGTPAVGGTLDVQDADGDGLADALVGCGDSGAVNTLAAYSGDGAGGWTAPVLSSFASVPEASASGDLDGDGDIDLLMATVGIFGTDALRALLGAGDGSFLQGATVAFPGFTPQSVAAGDFDADGDLDALHMRAAGFGQPQGTLIAVLGDGAGGLTARAPVAQAVALHNDLLVADLDEDGLLDAVATCTAGGSVAYFRGIGGAEFAAPIVGGLTDITPGRLASADVDHDGHLDLLEPAFDVVLLIPGDGAGGLERAVAYGSVPGFSGAPTPLEALDADSDGVVDVVLLGAYGLAVAYGTGERPDPWVATSGGSAGAAGQPRAQGSGNPVPAALLTYSVDNLAPGTPAVLVVGSELHGAPFRGGWLVPEPERIIDGLAVDPAGSLKISVSWPPGVPPGVELWLQTFQYDASLPSGLAATGGTRLRVP